MLRIALETIKLALGRIDPQTIKYLPYAKSYKKTRAFNIETHHLFIDFKAAYDKINRAEMLKIMKKLKMKKNVILFTKNEIILIEEIKQDVLIVMF